MGGSDTDTPEQGTKTSSSQEQMPTTSSASVYPDWSGFQAYSPIPPPGFFHSPMVSSPQAHPYMWGAQQFMPPYGTPPPPYVAMYPHGGLYPHPSMPPGSHPFSPYAMPSPNCTAEASGATLGGMEVDGKSSEDKEGSSMKRSKGSLGSLNMLMGKNSNEPGKTSGASANGFVSQSAESASEGSSEGSDANSQNDSQQKKRHKEVSDEAEASQNGISTHDHQNGVVHPPQTSLNQTMAILPMPAHGAPAGVPGPATNLNIGMDYWGGPTASSMPPLRGKVPANPGGPAGPSELWIQDERELKRQRRKQSNRESARRSRLRKQAECEELGQRVKNLTEENTTLISEVSRMREEYERLIAENTSLKGRLGEAPREHDDPRSDRNNQPSCNDGHQRHLDSGMRAEQKEPA